MESTKHATADAIRTMFARAMSELYRTEVPQYGTLLDLVAEVNRTTLAQHPVLSQTFNRTGERDRLHLERHGAIRLGSARELGTMARVFRVMGMVPVGYYDLSTAGLPVHSTAFRPIDEAALRVNPFRVFTSLLRLDLINDRALRRQAEEIVSARQIFTPGLLALLERHDRQGGLGATDAEAFVAEALETFRWHSTAKVNEQTYRDMQAAHRLVADVVCFRGPHINHLTPRTLDIDAIQAAMPGRGIEAKATIEGPPRRNCPILLRQTSFKALEEAILFEGAHKTLRPGTHTARFGEVEQRGAALTPKGRALYDRLLAKAQADATGGDPGHAVQVLAEVFRAFPDTPDELRRHGLVFYRYRAVCDEARPTDAASASVEELVVSGQLRFDPIVYEDFLPVSAAGIFNSNLGEDGRTQLGENGNQGELEAALGSPIHDEMTLYASIERQSLQASLQMLGAYRPTSLQPSGTSAGSRVSLHG